MQESERTEFEGSVSELSADLRTIAALLQETNSFYLERAMDLAASAYLGREMDLAEVSVPQPIALAVIRSLAFHPDFCVREEAAQWLSEFANEEDEYRITLLSHDAEWSVRCTAASCLADFKSSEARSRLREMATKDRVYTVRKWAVAALFDAGDDGTLASFLHSILPKEKNPFVRLAILSALAGLGEKGLKAEMLHLSEHPFLRTRRLRSLFHQNLAESFHDLGQL